MITASLVQALRERTGAGMMDCKKALVECNANMEEAVDWLRKKGLAAAAKKASRVACEGLVGVITQGSKGLMLEVNSETDFVARNDLFQEFVRRVLEIGLAKDVASLDSLKSLPYDDGRSVSEEITRLISIIGENISLRRMAYVSVAEGIVEQYIHGSLAEGLGKIGVLVGFSSKGDKKVLSSYARKIAMHIAASKPQALEIKHLDSSYIEREKAIFVDQARASGKSAEVAEKMVEGRLRKLYEEVVLMEQTSVLDGETKIRSFISQAEKESGSSIEFSSFERFALGEGLEKKEDNFAQEVACMVQKDGI